MIIGLNKRDIAIAEQAATLRWQLARASGVTNKRVDDTRTDEDIDLLGIKGEIAFSKAFGIDFNASALGIDSGNDVFFDDIPIQIKTTFYDDGSLIFTDSAKFDWAFCVLITMVGERRFRLAGAISLPAFERKKQRLQLGSKSAIGVRQADLGAISQLWEFLIKQRFQ